MVQGFQPGTSEWVICDFTIRSHHLALPLRFQDPHARTLGLRSSLEHEPLIRLSENPLPLSKLSIPCASESETASGRQ